MPRAGEDRRSCKPAHESAGKREFAPLSTELSVTRRVLPSATEWCGLALRSSAKRLHASIWRDVPSGRTPLPKRVMPVAGQRRVSRRAAGQRRHARRRAAAGSAPRRVDLSGGAERSQNRDAAAELVEPWQLQSRRRPGGVATGSTMSGRPSARTRPMRRTAASPSLPRSSPAPGVSGASRSGSGTGSERRGGSSSTCRAS